MMTGKSQYELGERIYARHAGMVNRPLSGLVRLTHLPLLDAVRRRTGVERLLPDIWSAPVFSNWPSGVGGGQPAAAVTSFVRRSPITSGATPAVSAAPLTKVSPSTRVFDGAGSAIVQARDRNITEPNTAANQQPGASVVTVRKAGIAVRRQPDTEGRRGLAAPRIASPTPNAPNARQETKTSEMTQRSEREARHGESSPPMFQIENVVTEEQQVSARAALKHVPGEVVHRRADGTGSNLLPGHGAEHPQSQPIDTTPGEKSTVVAEFSQPRAIETGTGSTNLRRTASAVVKSVNAAMAYRKAAPISSVGEASRQPAGKRDFQSVGILPVRDVVLESARGLIDAAGLSVRRSGGPVGPPVVQRTDAVLPRNIHREVSDSNIRRKEAAPAEMQPIGDISHENVAAAPSERSAVQTAGDNQRAIGETRITDMQVIHAMPIRTGVAGEIVHRDQHPDGATLRAAPVEAIPVGFSPSKPLIESADRETGAAGVDAAEKHSGDDSVLAAISTAAAKASRNVTAQIVHREASVETVQSAATNRAAAESNAASPGGPTVTETIRTKRDAVHSIGAGIVHRKSEAPHPQSASASGTIRVSMPLQIGRDATMGMVHLKKEAQAGDRLASAIAQDPDGGVDGNLPSSSTSVLERHESGVTFSGAGYGLRTNTSSDGFLFRQAGENGLSVSSGTLARAAAPGAVPESPAAFSMRAPFSGAGRSSSGAPAMTDLEVRKLADRVYQILVRRLVSEKERRGTIHGI
jgi:hypothetical protein